LRKPFSTRAGLCASSVAEIIRNCASRPALAQHPLDHVQRLYTYSDQVTSSTLQMFNRLVEKSILNKRFHDKRKPFDMHEL